MEQLEINLPEKFNYSTEIQVQRRDIGFSGCIGRDISVAYIIETLHRFLNSLGISMKFARIDRLFAIHETEAHCDDILKCEIAAGNFSLDSCSFYFLVRNMSGEAIIKASAHVTFHDQDKKMNIGVPKRLRVLH